MNPILNEILNNLMFPILLAALPPSTILSVFSPQPFASAFMNSWYKNSQHEMWYRGIEKQFP